jgi:hypothetical protein
MKKVFWISPIILTTILLLIACKKEEPSSVKEYPQWPAVKTLVATNVDSTKATLNATVNAFGLPTTVIFEYGTATDYGSTVTALQSPVKGDIITNVSADISGLTPNTIYYFRVKADNSKWINFCGPESTFITFPKAKTLAATNVSDNGATLNGAIGANLLSTTITFEYGKTTSYGNTVTASQSPVTGNTLSYVSANLKDLMADTTYHFRIKAENSLEVVYGSDMKFIAKGLTIITVEVTNITDSSAVLVGYIAGYLEDVTERGFYFIHRPMTKYAIIKDINATGTGYFHCNLKLTLYPPLPAGSICAVKSYAVNSHGIVFGNVLNFKTIK